jgi:hypothetical protein
MKEVMKIRTKIRLVMPALLLTVSSISYGQAAPAGVATINSGPVNPNPVSIGPNLSALDGIVHYALSASEIVQLGYYGPDAVTSSSALSADFSYTAKSTVRPFSILFAGGLLLPNQSGQGVSTYQNVAVTQGFVTRKWIFSVSDSFSFLPQSPTTGLSGIPGVGDLGIGTITGPVEGPAGGVLSIAGNRIANSLSGTVEREITLNTSISGSGSWSVLHYLTDAGEGGLDNDQISGVVSVNRRLDQRSSASVSAVYSVFNYSGSGAGPEEPNFQTKGLNFSYQRTLSRSLSMSASVGPQWVSSSDSDLIPSTVNVAISAGASYTHRYANASVNYTRGVNSGSGVLPGGLSDSVFASVGRSFGRNWVASVNGAYTHTSGLTQFFTGTSSVATHEVFNTVYAGVQVNRRFTPNLSGYLSYGAQNQSATYSFATQNALLGTSQTFGVGITFSPRSTRLGQF